MASLPVDGIEELAACSRCRHAFDEGERLPKLLDCKHHFCLQCARGALRVGVGPALRCVHCWQRTEPPEGSAHLLPTHGAVLALARHLALVTALTPTPSPAPLPWSDAEEQATREARLLAADLERLAARRHDYLLHTLEAVAALKLGLEAELGAPSAASVPADLDQLRERHVAALLQGRLDDAVCEAAGPLDFELLRLALATPLLPPLPLYVVPPAERRDPALFLANHCTAQLFARRSTSPTPLASPAPSAPGFALPLFYMELEVNGVPVGRVVIEVRAEAAPRMARNFAALMTGEGSGGVGYRGCSVFKCWENESVIAGDFELNDGRGGRSAFAESHFVPDDTRLAAVRGAVGMRRSRRRRDRLGLVGSQFRIVLREMRGFSAIFAYVAEGIELVDRLSRAGDSAGKPRDSIIIVDCGRLN